MNTKDLTWQKLFFFSGSFRKFYKLYNTSKKFAYQNAMVNSGGLLCTAFQIWMKLGSVGRLRPPFPIPEFSSRFIVQKYIECRERNKKDESTIFFQQIFLCLFLLRGISIFEIGSGGKWVVKKKRCAQRGDWDSVQIIRGQKWSGENNCRKKNNTMFLCATRTISMLTFKSI